MNPDGRMLATVNVRVSLGRSKSDVVDKRDIMTHDAISCSSGLPCCEIVNCRTYRDAIWGITHEGLHHALFVGFCRYGDSEMLEDLHENERGIDRLEKEKGVDLANIILKWCR